MSEWPRRYSELWVGVTEHSEGEYVTFEDFNDLLNYTVDIAKENCMFSWVNTSDLLKEAILRDIAVWKRRREDTSSVE